MKYLLTIAFDGRAYCGYQVQKNGISVQETLGRAAEGVFHCACSVTGCSRTDSGVHAKDFKATLDVPSEAPQIPPERTVMALNALLPSDIAVLDAIEVEDSFHARYAVTEKEYRYTVWNSRVRNPFLFGYAYHVPTRLDVDKMQEAAKAFLGTHDFASFMAAGSKVSDTVRTLYDLRVWREGDTVTFSVTGDGFLYHMVRILVGTLIAVSEGRLSKSDIPVILEKKDRTQAGPTAPACGLCLYRVSYDKREGGKETHV